MPHLIKAGKISENRSEEENAWVRSLISLYHDKMSYGAEIVEMSDLFFRDEVHYDEEAKEVLAGEQVPEVLKAPTLVVTKVVTKHMAPDVTGIIFWLKNRKPEDWSDSKEIALRHGRLKDEPITEEEILETIKSATGGDSGLDTRSIDGSGK